MGSESRIAQAFSHLIAPLLALQDGALQHSRGPPLLASKARAVEVIVQDVCVQPPRWQSPHALVDWKLVLEPRALA